MEKGLVFGSRYFIIVLVILGLVYLSGTGLGFKAISFALLFAINTQIRYFSLQNKRVLGFISIAFDVWICLKLVEISPCFLLPLFAFLILDSVLFLEGFGKYLSLTIILASFIYGVTAFSPLLYFPYISTMALIFLILLHTQRLQKKQETTEGLYHQLKKSEDKLLKANEELQLYADSIKELTMLQERNRISREIHDSVGHSLSTMIIQLGAIEKVAAEDRKLASQMAANLSKFAKSSLDEIRRALQEFKPKGLDKYATIAILESLTANFQNLTGIKVDFRFSKFKRVIDEQTTLMLYRAVQEFLSNSARHGKASEIKIFLHFQEVELILTMQDNGVGTDEIVLGMGLKGLTERVGELGGQVKIQSKTGKGFMLRIALADRANFSHTKIPVLEEGT